MAQNPLDPAGVTEALQLAAEAAHREKVERRAGGSLSAEAVGRLLGTGRQAVDERRRAGALLATPRGADWAYPRAQFHGSATIPGLADVAAGFEDSGPWIALEFLVTEDDTLDGLTPREALPRGGEMRERVMAFVRGRRGGEDFA